MGNSMGCGDGRRQGLPGVASGPSGGLGNGAYCAVLARSCVRRQSIPDSETWAAPSPDARAVVNGMTDEWGALRPREGPLPGT